jgi:prepilin-type N-terminal cleavage/methylation domain-containing protein
MRQKAFTLIELLVVIAIIGVIASIVLVNMRGSRRKATIGKALSFSQSINHGLGAYAVAIWTFDDSITDASSTDVSGYNNHGQIFGDPVQTKGIMRKALQFDGDDYLDCGNNGILYPASTLTIEVWIKTSSFSYDIIVGEYLNFTPSAFSYLLETTNNLNELSFFWSDGVNDYRSFPHVFRDLSEWTYVVVTFDDGVVKWYENGDLVATGARDPACAVLNQSPTRSLKIGGRGSDGYVGEIDELKIYRVPLEAGEIQKHYAEGLENRKLVEK